MNIVLYMTCGLLLWSSHQPKPVDVDPPAGIYLSKDEGESWTRADTGLPGEATVTAWAVMDNNVIVGTDDHGLYISYDGLHTWLASTQGLPPSIKVKTLATHQGTLFVGSFRHGIYASRDAGRSWQRSSDGIDASQNAGRSWQRSVEDIVITSIRCLYSFKGALYAGTNTGIYRSSDNGRNWEQTMQGVQINSFTSGQNTLYAATNMGALRSLNGMNWIWSWKRCALFTLSANQNVIASVTGNGEVYTCPAGTDQWMLLNTTFNQYTFRITPTSNPILIDPWRKTFRSMREQGVFHNTGLPEKKTFNRILNTPFGVLVAAGNDGC